jgi:DNA polymerase elongation subunit (family B)
MKLGFRIKHYFYNAFRELFVHHHGSLAFRAKLYALLIAVNEKATVDNFIIVKRHGLEIYKDDTDRANLLLLSTKELVEKVRENNGLGVDSLIQSIMQDLKAAPRYAKKIDIQSLKEFLTLTYDEDTLAYQNNILEFLQTLKDETLNKKNKA